MRALRLAAAALLACASTAVAPAHAAAPPLAARGVLGAETTLTWSGAAAIRLAVPKETAYRDRDVDLLVSGATFAFVRLMAPYLPGCPDHLGPRCDTDRVSWVHGDHDNGAYDGFPPSRRHTALIGIPATIRAPHLDVFLFTDGRATLTIRTTTLRGRTAYRPNARFRGHAGVIPHACVPLGCGDATGRGNGYTYGGMTYDLQGEGWAEFYVHSRTDPGGATLPNNGNQPRSVAGCLYPSPDRPAASADPAHHPYGCGDTTDPVAGGKTIAVGHGSGTGAGSGRGSNDPWSGARGKQYIGFQAADAGPGPSRSIAYGIWFRFLP